MSDKEIERWEEKAKSGLLFGDSTIRNLSMDLQNVLVSMASENGISLQEMEEMGISVNTVKTYYARALQALRKSLDGKTFCLLFLSFFSSER